ncbi:MAG TPA: FG-GAP-like repeat-containing protein [Thermoanaerobaculia bacterium]|jgi:hypothetical protein|nr:FG-GAP-like repeat-containing protein [Thermoanaerobaculia bacterium]
MKPPATVFLATALICAPLLADQALFRNASISYGGGAILEMTATDVNHDGKQDVIVFQAVSPSQSACSVITMFGNGDGTFRAPVKTAIASCGSIAMGDVDSDGNVDVVVSAYEGLIEVYRGTRDGSFTLRSTKTRAGYGGMNPLLTDLNGDGKLDLITSTACCQTSQTFRGNGDGTFADGVLQPDFLPLLSGIAAGDFNGDGRTDVLASTASLTPGGRWPDFYGRQSLITGRGDGNFNAPSLLSRDGGVAAVGDFNGDLRTDYVSMGAPTGFAFVHIGKGDGTFTTGATYITGAVSRALSVDLDGDGKLDIVAAGQDIVAVMRGNGDGTFVVNSYVGKPRTLETGLAATLVIADFDGDHHLDVLAGSDETLTLLHGNGDGSLAGYRKAFLETIKTAGAETGSIKGTLGGLAVADFNGDGKPEIVSKADGLVIIFNRGDGGFGPPLPLEVSNGASTTDPSVAVIPIAFAAADVNRDGKADIVVMSRRVNPASGYPYTSEVLTYLGNGDGTFHAAKATTFDDFFGNLTLHDMNGDGKLDALIFSRDFFSGRTRLFLGNGDGTFSLPIVLPGSPDHIADFNGDGLADFISNSGFYSSGYKVLLNNGSGRYKEKETVDIPWYRRAIAVGDFNNDGKQDFIDANYTGVVMRLGNGDGTFTDLPPFTLQNLTVDHIEGPSTVTADFNGDGNLDLAFENQILLGKGDGTFREIVPCVVARRPYSSDNPPIELAAGDIDGNGSDDLLLLDKNNVAVSILLTRTTAAGTTPLSLSASTSMPTLHPGEPVVVTVAAWTPSTYVPSGGIRIDDNGVFAAFAAWKDGSASATVAPPSVGQHTITASYRGDDVFVAGSAAVTQTAVKLDTQLGLRFYPPTPQVRGRTFVSADILPKQTSTTPPSGTVTIREGDTVLFTGAYPPRGGFPPSNQSAGFSYRFPTIGTHALTLDYSGDANYQAGSVTVAVPVTKAVGTVQLTTSPSSLKAGQSLTVQARVTAYRDLACCEEAIDGGTVTFRDFGAAIGTGPLVNGIASITIQPASGPHSYSATYNGNVNTDPVSSASTDYIVDAPPCAPPSDCSRRRAVH